MEAQQLNRRFPKKALINKLFKLHSNPYKICFWDQTVRFSTDLVFHSLPQLDGVNGKNYHVAITNFLNSRDLALLVGDGHLDAENALKYIKKELQKVIEQELQQEFERYTVTVYIDFTQGALHIKLKWS
ncbi:MAG: hypothetical protein K1X55_10315 [Chitinophagales bacterium]|nr:hypothetical protein [Chitinophagales bacterium]